MIIKGTEILKSLISVGTELCKSIDAQDKEATTAHIDTLQTLSKVRAYQSQNELSEDTVFVLGSLEAEETDICKALTSIKDNAETTGDELKLAVDEFTSILTKMAEECEESCKEECDKEECKEEPVEEEKAEESEVEAPKEEEVEAEPKEEEAPKEEEVQKNYVGLLTDIAFDIKKEETESKSVIVKNETKEESWVEFLKGRK